MELGRRQILLEKHCDLGHIVACLIHIRHTVRAPLTLVRVYRVDHGLVLHLPYLRSQSYCEKSRLAKGH